MRMSEREGYLECIGELLTEDVEFARAATTLAAKHLLNSSEADHHLRWADSYYRAKPNFWPSQQDLLAVELLMHVPGYMW